MIGKEEGLRKVCRNYEQVENYEKAVADEEIWDLHHRREIDEMKSKQQLIDEERYFDVEPEELIFLTHSEHTKLHNMHKRPETRKKLSEAMKGENHYFYGKHHSAAAKQKISEAMKGENHPMYGKPGTMTGKHHSAAAKQKISEAKKGNQNMMGKHHSAAAKQKISEAKKGKPNGLVGKRWWNNGTYNKFSKECPGEGFVRGRLKFNK